MITNGFHLFPNYPNPFNPTTTIGFNIDGETLQATSLRIYDILGRLMETLVDEQLGQGIHEIQWNAANQPSGIYFIQLRSRDFIQTQKAILVK